MNTSKHHKKAKIRPVLFIDHLSDEFGLIEKNNAKSQSDISERDKIALTLIASIIVEIVIKEYL